MGRILAIDYGTKRVGVAETDDLKIIASPLETVHSTKIVAFILDYSKKHELEAVVIGEPKTLDNLETDSTKVINEFVVHLGRKLPGVSIERVDERFTSKFMGSSKQVCRHLFPSMFPSFKQSGFKQFFKDSTGSLGANKNSKCKKERICKNNTVCDPETHI